MGLIFLAMFLIGLIIISVITLIIGGITEKKGTASSVLLMWGVIILIGTASYIGKVIRAKKVLDKNDFYGTYVIDRNYFPGKQSDWQYNNFRFEIKENDSIYFYVTNENITNETYKGKISTLTCYESERLIIKMEEPNHHILKTNPTIYRESWDFFLVFNSPKFSNMYFRKGKWKEID